MLMMGATNQPKIVWSAKIKVMIFVASGIWISFLRENIFLLKMMTDSAFRIL